MIWVKSKSYGWNEKIKWFESKSKYYMKPICVIWVSWFESKKPVIRIRVLEGFPFQFDSNQEILWVESDCCELNQTFMWFESWKLKMNSWALWVCFESDKFWDSNHIGKISFSQKLKSFFRFYYDHDSNHSQK